MSSRSPLPPAQLIALLGALAAFGPLAIDLYLPALPAIAHGLGASIEAVQSSVTVFLAGFSLGMLLYGPLSDRYGRRPVLLAGMALFTVASLACWLADSVELLIAARFAQAMGGGAASVLARAVARDVFAPKEAIRQLSRMAMVTSVAPLLAPMLGSAVLAWGGWRSPFAVLCVWGVLSTAVVAWVLAETLPPERRGGLTLGQAFAAYGQMLRQPAAVGLLLAGGLSFAAMFAYITASPDFFIGQQGWSPSAYALVFAANALGIFTANFINSRLAHRLGAATLAGAGSLAGLLAALVMNVALLGAAPAMGWVVGALAVAVSVTGLLGANCVGLLMQRFAQASGAAAALFGASQFGLGMLASAAVSALHDGSGRPMGWVMLACLAGSAAGFVGFWRAR